MFRRRTLLARFALFACCFGGAPIWAAGPYFVTNLGVLPGYGQESQALDINAAGQVVGHSEGSSTPQVHRAAFLWSPATPNGTTGSLVNLGELEPESPFLDITHATAINTHGQITGDSYTPYGQRATIWTPSVPNTAVGSMIDLGPTEFGVALATATGINSRGQAAGYFLTNTGRTAAYLWSPDSPNGQTGAMVEIGALPDLPDYSFSTGINDAGQVVGRSGSHAGVSSEVGVSSAFLWTPDTVDGESGSMVNLGGLPNGYTETEPSNINSYGQVIGYAFNVVPAPSKAFLWTPNTPNGNAGSMIDLGHLPGGDTSIVHGINSLGQVVGQSSYGMHPGQQYQNHHAFLWTPTAPNGTTGTMVDLDTLLDPETSDGWVIFAAHAINDRGQIAAMGLYDPDGPFRNGNNLIRGVLLTPVVPEPSSLLLFAIGAAAAGSARNRVARRRQVD